jgi:Na+-transporting methylmalonyl-CoA/oxaloacetate decarboxylase gamma subunit
MDPKDHVEQLKRIFDDMKAIADGLAVRGVLMGINWALYIVAVISFIAGWFTAGAGFVITFIALIALLLTMIAKLIEEVVNGDDRRRLDQLKREIEAKQAEAQQALSEEQ